MKKTIVVTEREWTAIYNALREAESKRAGEDYPTPAEEKALAGIRVAIKAVQKASAVPVTHAKWLPIEVDADAGPLLGNIKTKIFLCSACKTHRKENFAIKPGYRYCPDCGAKMDQE